MLFPNTRQSLSCMDQIQTHFIFGLTNILKEWSTPHMSSFFGTDCALYRQSVEHLWLGTAFERLLSLLSLCRPTVAETRSETLQCLTPARARNTKPPLHILLQTPNAFAPVPPSSNGAWSASVSRGVGVHPLILQFHGTSLSTLPHKKRF
jgi:hypothetical protein